MFGSKLATIVVSSLLLSPLAVTAQMNTVLKTIQETGVLKVAIREDAAPFGFLDRGSNLTGFCLDFFVLLRTKVNQHLAREVLAIRLLKSTATSRFAMVANGSVNLECGPNTIRPDIPEQITFSRSFFTTGTQFLVNQINLNKLDLDDSLENIKIGVLGNTSTEDLVQERYPLATLERFAGINGRTRGVEALQQVKITLMASDGILLRAEAQRQNLAQQQYPLIPETPLTCDRYGMIITNDAEWQDFINSVITSPEAQKLYTRWFPNIITNIKTELETCQLSNK